MDNKQIKEILTNINTLLGKISVRDEDVFHMSDCRRALGQVITNIPVDDEVATDK